MKRSRILTACLCAAALTLARPESLRAATTDDNVEWGGVSHIGHQDRRPLCPVSGETFQVRLQCFTNDLTGVRVRLDTGSVSFIAGAVIGTRGPYDVWGVQIPATAASGTLNYLFELTDGSDVDWYSVGGMTDALPVDGGFVVNFATLLHAPLGATLLGGGTGTVFKVWAPTRTSTYVRGSFNGWGMANPLAKVGEYFIGRINTANDLGYYKYFFNNAVWNSDPRARWLDATSSYNSRIESPFRYSWTLPDFVTPPIEEMVIYQLHVGTFSGRNDPLGTPAHPARFPDVAARAGHLAELGVNAVLLNPITEFPTDLSAGYNPITQWSPEWRYGTPDEFKQMVDVLHQHGIAVLLDIVWNHFSPTDNYLWNYDGSQTWFDTPVVDTPWGSQADFDKSEVRDYFLASALHWLEEYKVDGFRMDATSFMDQGAHATVGYTLMQKFNDLIDNRWADKVTIAEELPNDFYITRPTSLGGAGFDSQYHDAFTDRLREEITDSGFTSPEMWKMANIVNGSGTHLTNRNVTNYFELHDEVWPSNGGQRMVKTIDTTFPHDDIYARGRSKLAQGLVMLAPGVPAFHQGNEWLEDTGFGADAANRIDWAKKTTYADVFRYYQDLIALRTGNPALRADAGHFVFRIDEAQDILGFDRTNGDDVLVVLVNFSPTARSGYRVGLPLNGNWQEALNSQAPLYGGAGPLNPGTLVAEAVPADGRAQSLALSLPAMSVVVLKHQTGQTGTPEHPPVTADRLIQRVWPNPLEGSTTVAFRLEGDSPVRIEVLDLRGRRVAVLSSEFLPAGMHERRWNGRDDHGRPVAAGVYLLRVVTPGGAAARKVTVTGR